MGFFSVGSDADHETICVLILNLAVDTEVLVAGGIVNLDFALLLLNILDALVHIQHRWLVILGERVVEVVGDEARFAH